jgi:hypothetical protein
MSDHHPSSFVEDMQTCKMRKYPMRLHHEQDRNNIIIDVEFSIYLRNQKAPYPVHREPIAQSGDKFNDETQI